LAACCASSRADLAKEFVATAFPVSLRALFAAVQKKEAQFIGQLVPFFGTFVRTCLLGFCDMTLAFPADAPVIALLDLRDAASAGMFRCSTTSAPDFVNLLK
jgi:hypothetical protein